MLGKIGNDMFFLENLVDLNQLFSIAVTKNRTSIQVESNVAA